MVQELQILHWCDPDIQRDGRKVPGRPYPMVTPSGEVVNIDLCEEHAQALKPFYELAEAAAKAAKSAARRGAADDASPDPAPAQGRQLTKHLVCPAPTCDRAYSTRSGIHGHLRQEHHITLSQWEGRLGHMLPESPGDGTKAVTVWCATCGAGFAGTASSNGHTARYAGHEPDIVSEQPAAEVYPSEVRSWPVTESSAA